MILAFVDQGEYEAAVSSMGVAAGLARVRVRRTESPPRPGTAPHAGAIKISSHRSVSVIAWKDAWYEDA